MGSPPERGAESRCPSCGALVTADAAWCGQCLRPLAHDAPAESTPAATHGGAAPETSAGAASSASTPPQAGAVATTAPTWPCPVCEHLNPIELDACAVCGTSFAALMNRDAAVVHATPDEAFRASLHFPGLGHRKAGRNLDGLARGALFVLLAGMAALIALGGFGSGVLFGLFVLYLGLAIAVYIGSAIEARHLAEGGGLLLPTRQVLWAAVIVVMASMGLLVVSVIATTKR
jgi:hypothetical protein